METSTYEIYQDGILKRVFPAQTSDFPALRWLQANQGQSFQWATRYGGWKVVEINDQTGIKTELK